MRHSEDVTNRIFGVIVYVNSSELACTLILYHSVSVKLERKASSEARYFNAERFTIHQDPPVKMPNQILAIHNAVNRKTESGRVLGEHQRISVMEAIKAVTINGAYQYFEEDSKGSIEVGKLADLVIVDKNPLTIPVEELETIKVLETIKEGNVIFKRD